MEYKVLTSYGPSPDAALSGLTKLVTSMIGQGWRP
jgi:hypothetical protein